MKCIRLGSLLTATGSGTRGKVAALTLLVPFLFLTQAIGVALIPMVDLRLLQTTVKSLYVWLRCEFYKVFLNYAFADRLESLSADDKQRNSKQNNLVFARVDSHDSCILDAHLSEPELVETSTLHLPVYGLLAPKVVAFAAFPRSDK